MWEIQLDIELSLKPLLILNSDALFSEKKNPFFWMIILSLKSFQFPPPLFKKESTDYGAPSMQNPRKLSYPASVIEVA